ncbi:hypothetical protein TRFO_33150 [Tritrichomonas foetus]|uniref:Uncharacterized protein n=1 Tax=Tritrichomonas foetus TaxID=1144522 RepID=A0A1J4JRQ6_9EUKA|nr:hypothetical protein TRFO_33150 [Tritrichomonas foetus]|eukprot:OHT00204.1 hypothetical protein TRFO_33150 [Tritrichomonas foetus]
MDYYEKLIKDEENQHFIEFNQQLSVNNIASDDFSRSNVNQIRQMKSELVALKDFAKEQIEVVQRKLNDLIEHLQTRPPREVDRITINQLEEQTKNVTHRLQYLMKDYNLTKKLMVKKEKEYNKKFGFNPKIGILRTNPICLRPNYV